MRSVKDVPIAAQNTAVDAERDSGRGDERLRG
jgi:hypothetical protein